MTTRYVDGTNGNNAWDGLAPNFVSGTNGPKATLTGMEATPPVAGDLVHVRAGVYREALTVGVSGTLGNVIEYRGDYQGLIWPGGGVVRITGSNNDQTATRSVCITATSKNYRTFRGFSMDICIGIMVTCTDCQNWVIDKCALFLPGTVGISYAGASQLALAISNCVIHARATSQGILMTHTAGVDNAGHTIQNCLFRSAECVMSVRVGGIAVKNCLFSDGSSGVRVGNALTVGQLVMVNNCIFINNSFGVRATTTAEFSEDYNNFYANGTDRSNVTAGPNSKTYPPLFDMRAFFEMMYGGRMLSPFDLASYSQLVNLAGTSPPATDMRGTAVIGAQREWGALEMDATLKIAGGGGGNVFGGTVVR